MVTWQKEQTKDFWGERSQCIHGAVRELAVGYPVLSVGEGAVRFVLSLKYPGRRSEASLNKLLIWVSFAKQLCFKYYSVSHFGGLSR